MKVISFLNSKGGTGKSTTVINVARGLQLRGFSVAALDTDTHQQSLAQWRQDASEDLFPIHVVEPHDVPNTAAGLTVDYLLIDGVGSLGKEVVGIAKVSDLIVIPVTSALDYWPGARLFTSLKPLDVVTAYLLTQATKNTKMHNEMLQTLAESGSAFDSVIYSRTAYQFSILSGETVYEHDKIAATEVDAVINEILEVI